MSEQELIIEPRRRHEFAASPGFEAGLAQALNNGALANGWLISGGPSSGKATLAYRLARSLLWRERPPDCASLDVPETSRAYLLTASGGHPDLFVAERRYDEKKERQATEITVETIRDLGHFLAHTPSMGGWRVAIIDTADDLNRNSANALLKALEEPPPRTAIFVLSSAPGRLLPTIRSRCRRIVLRPLSDMAIAEFLEREGAASAEQAQKYALAAGGRPGYALSLARGEGAFAIDALEEFWSAAIEGSDVGGVAQKFSGRNSDGVFDYFRSMLSARLAAEAVAHARAADPRAGAFLDLKDFVDPMFSRGEAVNLDRGQMLLAAARAFKSVQR